ncbi:MAG TPA: hypothetical protein VK539_33900 [Myxococcaceae bacterium]|nr:hypothetical protein [Myxococcaceae bacterium]
MSRILALLDRPQRQSLGIVPLVISQDEKIQVLGLAPASAHRGRNLSAEDVEHLIRAHHAMRSDATAPDILTQRHAALWMGAEFTENSKKLGLPLPPLPRSVFQTEEGAFAIGEASDLYPYLDAWTDAAFTSFLMQRTGDGKRAFADLMRWVLPSDPRTLAAAWHSAPDSSRELAIQHHIFGAQHSAAQWKALLQKTITNYRSPLNEIGKVFAFIGGSASPREKIADRFAGLVNSDTTSFTKAIKRRVSGAADAPLDKKQLMEQGQHIVEEAPLTMTMDVLQSAFGSPAALGSPHRSIVIDSVRHQEILDVIWWLVPHRVIPVSVFYPPEKRRADLIRRGDNPEEVLSHPTEKQIEDLSQRAAFRVDATKEWDPQLLQLKEVYAA